MAREPWTAETFEARYHQSPQEFFAETVHNDATGANIPKWEKEVAAAKAELAKIPTGIPDDGREEGGYTHLTAILKTAELETLINAREKGDLYTAAFRQKGAKAFLAGEITDYLPYIMRPSELGALIDDGLVDTTINPDAA